LDSVGQGNSLALPTASGTCWTFRCSAAIREHLNARLIIFEESAHSPFDDEPEAFFTTLKDFIVNLPEVPSEKLEHWKTYLTKWREEKKAALSSSVMTSE
jgi:hypothetical protein